MERNVQENISRNSRIGKKDLILLILLFAVLIIIFLGFRARHQTPGGTVEIRVDGELYGTYSLIDEQKIPIRSGDKITNYLEIKDGYANMTEADCPDKLCVHQSRIHAKGETIVCLPNKVVVSIIDGEMQEMDTKVS